MLKVGLIGCGNMGRQICHALTHGQIRAQLIGLWDIDLDRVKETQSLFPPAPAIMPLKDMVEEADLVVEASHPSAVAEIAHETLMRGKDIMVMSVGGLVEHPELFELARQKGAQIHIPSGAIAGVDAIRAAALNGLKEVTLITRKPPRGLAGAPYLQEKGIDLSEIKEETLLFDGPAREAIKAFPQNVNVAATLSLVGLGVDRTRVKVLVNPLLTVNCHEVIATGDFGTIRTMTENLPSPENPKTSQLAVLSAIATLKELAEARHDTLKGASQCMQ